jgi:8-oxo-dGTP diphosphatase
MISVACAIIKNKNKVLCVQRSSTMSLPLKWEFPGGKVEQNETAESCIKREILEELNVKINIIASLGINIHRYAENLVINLIPFICEISEGQIRLNEHRSYCWLQHDELIELDWAEADLPIVEEFLRLKL